MFTIPAAELGTSLAVYVDTSTTPNSRFASMGTVPQTYIQITRTITTVAELKTWIATASVSQLDTVYLPHVEYASIAADWMGRSAQSATAFKVGDCVTWTPGAGSMSNGALVPGQVYYIIGCVFLGPPACWSLSLSAGGNMVDVADEDELTIVIQPSVQLSLFGVPSGDVGYDLRSPTVKRCECGATKCKSRIHSPWCPMA